MTRFQLSHPTVLVSSFSLCLFNCNCLLTAIPDWSSPFLLHPPSCWQKDATNPSVINTYSCLTSFTNAEGLMPLYLVQGYSRLQSHWHTLLASIASPLFAWVGFTFHDSFTILLSLPGSPCLVFLGGSCSVKLGSTLIMLVNFLFYL